MLRVRCPRVDCGGDEMRLAERNGVEIDYCPVCRGVWLDRGELDKIIEQAAQQNMGGFNQPQRPPQYQQSGPPPQKRHDYGDEYEDEDYRRRDSDRDYDDERRRDSDYEDPKKKRKSSWLGELFDF